MITIYFVVVNYNNFEYTKSLCHSLSLQAGTNKDFNAQCIIVNNSTDLNDTKKLSEYCQNISWLSIVSCPDNPGYFGGLNRGLERIADLKNKLVVIGNNDLEFDKDFCRNLIHTKYAKNIHVVCPCVITVDGYYQNPLVQQKISAFRRFQFDVYFSSYYIALLLGFIRTFSKDKRNKAIKKNALSPGELYMGIGACYVLLPGFFEHSSKLECPVFLYGEEAFLSHQVHSNDGILYFDPSLKTVHAESAALSKIPPRETYEYAKEGYPLYRLLL
jgi:GT2 family glycosyltransferase